MAILKAGDLKKTGGGQRGIRWTGCYGHHLEWVRDTGEVYLRMPDGAFYELDRAESAVEAKQRYVNFRESDQ